MQRRDFFAALASTGAAPKAWAQKKNKLKHHAGERLYHGPMLIPAHVAETVRESPEVYRTTHRHPVLRYVDSDQTVYLLRSRVPESRAMIGEIVRTPEGRVRVHCWSAARTSTTYREVSELLARRATQLTEQIMPPLAAPIWDMEAILDDDLPSAYLRLMPNAD